MEEVEDQLLVEQWYAQYQSENPEKFNEAFIYNKGSSENMKDIIAHVSKAMESTGHIKYLDCTIEEDESKFTDIHKIEESRLYEATIRFKIFCVEDGKHQEEEVSIKLLLPRVINNFFFKINGIMYYAIYQMIDRGTYAVGNNTIGLKTMLMPFVIRRKEEIVEDIEGTQYRNRIMELDVFKRTVNIMLYYISDGGWDQTLRFFGLDGLVSITDQKPTQADLVNDAYFEIGKKFWFKANRNFLEQDRWVLGSLVSLLSKARFESLEDLQKPEFWNFQLGKIYTTTKDQAANKADKIHTSVRRILDGCTSDNMVHVLPKDKKSIYHLFRWILWFYDDLIREDNMDIKNKRLRLNEYVLYPFIKKLSTETYRCLNTRKVTMKILRSMFSNIKPNICLKQLVTNELLRFANGVNGIELFSAAMKITQAGPQGLTNRDNVPMRYRGIHDSYVGVLDLAFSSADDPGITASLVPFVKTDGGGLFFDRSVKYVTPDLPEVFIPVGK